MIPQTSAIPALIASRSGVRTFLATPVNSHTKVPTSAT